MTINDKMRAAVKNVPAITDFFYSDPDKILSNETVGDAPLFRLLRAGDRMSASNIGIDYDQNEVLMFTKVMERTPQGDDEEAAENELIINAFNFLAALEAQGVEFFVTANPRWGRRDASRYALGLIVEITILKTFTAVGSCVQGNYFPEPLKDQQC